MKKFLLVPLICLSIFGVCIFNISAASCQTPGMQTDLYERADGGLEAAPSAQHPADQEDIFYKATIRRIVESGTVILDDKPQAFQVLELELRTGANAGKKIIIQNGKEFVIGTYQRYGVGDDVVVTKTSASVPGQKDFYYITDRYRVPQLGILTLIFFAVAIFFGRKRGVTSIIGMLFSVAIIFYYIIPHILAGDDPLRTCIVGATLIILVSLYLSHGLNRRTTIALCSTLLALALAIVIDVLFVHVAKLAGTGTEEAFYLQFDTFTINLQGLLLGGIIIGVLGVLDDVTTGQAAAVEEISAANTSLDFAALYKSGISVGREHIASLINTLVLAYAGVSFPLLLLYASQKTQPLWVTLNSNFVAEEIVRTLVGSVTLVIAVPLTTMLAAWWYGTIKKPSL